MDNLAGIIIMAVCAFGCAFLFLGIGVYAERSMKPIHFWAGSRMDPAKVLDIPAYNHACAVMWKCYSIPFWLCGIFACLDGIHPVCMIISTVLLFAACVPGLFWLIRKYKYIEKQFLIPE